ncbi:MAG: hypothetical protein IPM26_09640 [Saprospiraceae bacterium]|nr:hypothetical protein [Saprospiraceae bacterium]
MTKSIYYEHNGSTFVSNGKYNEDFAYHPNGRINTVLRNGHTLNNQSSYQIDNLTYIYAADNLRMLRVQDANTSNNSAQGHNQNNITGTAFTYDACGNVTSDLHRSVSGITYNHLHLPTLIQRSNGSKLEMTYDADGNLLCRKTFGVGSTLNETRDYIGGAELVNNEVSQINHSQGRLQKNGTLYRMEYVIKDHLGNTKVVYYDNGGTATVIDEDHYYAYGMEYGGFPKVGGTATYNYKFNGIERAESFNLDFALYRGLDPVLGVWMQVDPKAEQVIGMYPYCAMGNNPVSLTDPDGDLPFLAVIGIAFATGVTTNGINNLNNGENFWSNGFSAGLWSAASGAVTFGIGEAFGPVGKALKEFGRAGAHSLASGTFSHLQGGNFWHGATSGGISSLGGSGMQALKFGDPAMIAGSAALGGLGSKLSGGGFWQGFGTGLAIGAFNHAMEHAFGGDPGPDKRMAAMTKAMAKMSPEERHEFIKGNLEMLAFIGSLYAGEGVLYLGGRLVSTIRATWLARAAKGGANFLKFGGDEAVVHFGKHADQIMKVTGKSAYNLKNYVDDANWIIQNGTYSSKLNGYYHYMGNAAKGESLFGFVGMKNGGSTISTFHIKTATQLGLK